MSDNTFIPRDEKVKLEAKKQKKAARFKIPRPKIKASQSMVQIINGDFLSKEFMLNNLAYIFFIMLLLIVLVSKGYYVNQLATDINKTEETLGQVTADYVEAKARLEEETKRTNLIQKLESTGLKETVNPTKVIRKRKTEE
jgi:cell division protein FtsL